MIELADRLGAEALVTGHYARVSDGLLRVAADREKDQSYSLAAVSPGSLGRLRFPLGELRKGETRELARRHGLPVAAKPDSQDLCFLAGTGRDAFFARHGAIGARDGAIVDRRGRELGRHEGAHRYTVGQRKGLGIGGGHPLYVLQTDVDANTITVGPREALATRAVRLRDMVLHGQPFDRVRLRYRQHPLRARHLRGDLLELDEPAYGVAPGQLACLMAGELVVGHATIAASA
jgi:tRNA-specific 2-thiouridylase